MAYIEVNNLSKNYKIYKPSNKKGVSKILNTFSKREYININAIRDLSFSIDKADIVGYIGPNGAGKSTTIKILSGILRPDEGTCLVDGKIPWDNRKEYVKNIGVMFGQRSQLLWDLPAIDSFIMLKKIYNLSNDEYETSITMLSEMLDLDELLNKPVRQMSLGEKIRCELAATFIHKPKLVFLDEPTIGVDIEMKKKFHEFIKMINKTMNVTIFITTHDLDDIESLCNKLMIINKGEIYFHDTIDSLFSNHYIEEKIFVELADDDKELLIPGDLELKSKNGNKYVLTLKKDAMLGDVIRQVVENNEVVNIYKEKSNIEDIILKIYRDFKVKK